MHYKSVGRCGKTGLIWQSQRAQLDAASTDAACCSSSSRRKERCVHAILAVGLAVVLLLECVAVGKRAESCAGGKTVHRDRNVITPPRTGGSEW